MGSPIPRTGHRSRNHLAKLYAQDSTTDQTTLFVALIPVRDMTRLDVKLLLAFDAVMEGRSVTSQPDGGGLVLLQQFVWAMMVGPWSGDVAPKTQPGHGPKDLRHVTTADRREGTASYPRGRSLQVRLAELRHASVRKSHDTFFQWFCRRPSVLLLWFPAGGFLRPIQK